MKAWLFLSGAIIFEVTASLSLKAALDNPWWYGSVAVGYTAAFAFLGLVLRSGMELGAAYGIWGATGVALTAAFSALLYHEQLTPLMLLGMTLIVAGVLSVEFGAQQAHKKADLISVDQAGEAR